jgi:hypothetical protein
MRLTIFSNIYGHRLFKFIVAFAISLTVIVVLGNLYLYYLIGLDTFNAKDLYQSAWRLASPAFVVAMIFAIWRKR